MSVILFCLCHLSHLIFESLIDSSALRSRGMAMYQSEMERAADWRLLCVATAWRCIRVRWRAQLTGVWQTRVNTVYAYVL